MKISPSYLFGLFLLLTFNLSLSAQPMVSASNPLDPPADPEGIETAVPEGLSYQAIARDAQGNVMPNSRIGIRIELIKGEEGNEVEFSELHHIKTDATGQFSLVIGHGKNEVGEFKAVKWEEGNKWLQLSLDINEKGEFDFMGKSQLLSVPYAMYAGSAGNIKGADKNFRGDDGDWNLAGSDIYRTSGRAGIGTSTPSGPLDIREDNHALIIGDKGSGNR